MTTYRPLLVGITLVIALQATRGYADEPSEPEQLYQVGQAAFDGKQYDDAIAAWERSYEISKEPALLFNIAQAYRLRGKPGDCTKATAAYNNFVALDPSSPQRAEAASFVTAIQECVANEAPKPTPSPPVMPAPKPTPTVTAPAPVPTSAPSDGQPDPVRIKKLVGIGLAASGVVLVVTGIYFGRKASSLGDEVTAACAVDCNWAVYGPKDARGRSAETKQYVFLGVGGAAIIGGGVLYLLAVREHRARVVVSRRGDGAVVTWNGAW